MAKATQPEPLALEALVRSLGDPVPRVLHGSKSLPGIFTGASAAEKAAAKYCLDHAWLVPTGEASGKGKTCKGLYRLGPAGLQAVLAKSDPTALLRVLGENLARLEEEAARIPHAVEAASVAAGRQLAALSAELKQGLTDALRPFDSLPAALQELKRALTATLEQVKPVDIDELSKRLAPAPPAAEPVLSKEASWGDDVIRMAGEQKQRNPFQRLTLPQVFERVRAQHPHLTLGQFHDGLRRLQDEKRIRLGPYTQALATLDDPRNALFLDREVKYYVELP